MHRSPVTLAAKRNVSYTAGSLSDSILSFKLMCCQAASMATWHRHYLTVFRCSLHYSYLLRHFLKYILCGGQRCILIHGILALVPQTGSRQSTSMARTFCSSIGHCRFQVSHRGCVQYSFVSMRKVSDGCVCWHRQKVRPAPLFGDFLNAHILIMFCSPRPN